MAAHHRLHRLGQHFPGGVEVGGQPLGVDAELAQPLGQRFEADQCMPERGAQRAQHGRVGQVALPAADRKLFGEVLQQCIGDAEVALRIFEIDRVDLVRHRRGAHFAGLHRLAEVAERDVAPDVAAQVNGDGVDAPLHVAQLGDAVVRFDLRGVGVEVQAQRFDEALRERGPVDVRICGQVGVVVADRAVDLAGHLDRGQLPALPLQPGEHVGQLLAHGGGRGRLAMRAREHRQRGVRMRHRAQGAAQPVQRRQQHLFARLPQQQRVAEVVDVLGRAGEMHELQRPRQVGVVAQAFLDPVLHRLDVVVGGGLDLLDAGGVGGAEVARQVAQPFHGRRRQRRQLLDGRLSGQRQQPFDLDVHAGADQSGLGEDRPQRRHLAGVAAVERGQG